MLNPLRDFTTSSVIAIIAAIASGCGGSGAEPTAPPDEPHGASSTTSFSVVAVGDIACPPGSPTSRTRCGQSLTARLARRLDPTVVLTLGDEQYNSGKLEEFNATFDSSWGRLLEITRPVPGNHEYAASGVAAGYRTYFGKLAIPERTTWYSFDVGPWHLIALDSNCDEVPGGCDTGSPQQRWLSSDLRANDSTCTLAYWHHPRFSSGVLHGSSEDVDELYATLDSAGADVILAGHEHSYERFAPQDHTGAATEQGIRQFVVGTGGKSLYPFGRPIANSQVRSNDSFGVLELRLMPDSYRWRFHPTSPRGTSDHGEGRCH
ncbi:MAG: phoA [Thermoleophilia bacterium]|nr:phoA [Thermoleophilia bacterium]